MTETAGTSDRLRILYQDNHLVAVHKPSGMLVHRTSIDRHESRIAMPMLRDQLGQRVYPAHRLDKPTSGILLFSLDPETASRVGEAFTEHRVRKDYLAIVRGWTPLGGLIDYPLRPRDPNSSNRRQQNRTPEPAKTLYHRVATTTVPVSVDGRYRHTRYSLVRLRPITGRRHQLRRHLKTRSHPIIGDANYGKGIHNRFFSERYGVNRLLLCAVRLVLPHPISGAPLVIETQPDADFRHVMQQIGLDGA